MTVERIKEEFEKWLYSDDMSKEEASFPDYFDDIECDDTEFLAHGFYAGFRAAERLAKIEVLEELDKLITSTGSKVATMQKISAMLSDLKAAK
jgi:hypothetical protein